MSSVTRYTIADLEDIPTPWDDTRYGLIDGELHVSPQSHLMHQAVTGSIILALHRWDTENRVGFPIRAPGVIFSPEDSVAPDVVWISRQRLATGADDNGHIRTAPELMVEVLSPGTTHQQRDRVAKLRLYSREGVDEYWIVDWESQTVEVYRRSGAELVRCETLANGDYLTSPLSLGFSFPVHDLWSTFPQPKSA